MIVYEYHHIIVYLIKKYKWNWTLKIFTIDKVQDTKPITYLLTNENNEEIKECFYRQDLQMINL